MSKNLKKEFHEKASKDISITSENCLCIKYNNTIVFRTFDTQSTYVLDSSTVSKGLNFSDCISIEKENSLGSDNPNRRMMMIRDDNNQERRLLVTYPTPECRYQGFVL